MSTQSIPASETIDANEFAVQLRAGNVSLCLDVRTGAEFNAFHCKGSECLPLQELDSGRVKEHLQSRGLPDSEPLYLICQAGKRAQMAAQKLAGSLPNPICVVAGGVQALPADLLREQGPAVMSLERQVRIAAGVLVLLGLLLSQWFGPWGLALSGFVGAGLVFAGVTDTCGMGMLLARMPWNKG